MQNFNSKVKQQGVKTLTTNENNPEHLEVAFTAEIFTTYSYHERQHFVNVSVAPHFKICAVYLFMLLSPRKILLYFLFYLQVSRDNS